MPTPTPTVEVNKDGADVWERYRNDHNNPRYYSARDLVTYRYRLRKLIDDESNPQVIRRCARARLAELG